MIDEGYAGYYFGCRRESGHFLFRPDYSRPRLGQLVCPWTPERLDAGLFRHHSGPEGVARLLRHAGWTMLDFCDRSIDSRPGSHSCFVLRGELTFEQAVATARGLFPDVWQRFSFPVVLDREHGQERV